MYFSIFNFLNQYTTYMHLLKLWLTAFVICILYFLPESKNISLWWQLMMLLFFKIELVPTINICILVLNDEFIITYYQTKILPNGCFESSNTLLFQIVYFIKLHISNILLTTSKISIEIDEVVFHPYIHLKNKMVIPQT